MQVIFERYETAGNMTRTETLTIEDAKWTGDRYGHTKAEKANAVERVRAGESRLSVAREYGVPRWTIDDWVSRAQADAEADAVITAMGHGERHGVKLHVAMLGRVMGL